MVWSWGIVETRDRHMRLGKGWLGSWWALPFYDNSVFPEGGLGHPLILAVAGMCVACRDLGRIIPNAENTPGAREVHKQKSRPFLQSWYILILKFLSLNYPGRLCFCRVGEATRDRARRRQTPTSTTTILTMPPLSFHGCGHSVIASASSNPRIFTNLVPAVVGGLRPALREGGASSPDEPIAFVFICGTRQELFTEKQDSWSLLKLLTPRAWSRPGSITDSGSLECGALLQSFCLKGRIQRTPEKEKGSCANTTLAPGACLEASKDLPLYIPIISLNKLVQNSLPAFSTAGTKQTAELQNPGVCSVLSAQPRASGRSLPLSSVGTCRHLPWCSLRKSPFWCPSRFSW